MCWGAEREKRSFAVFVDECAKMLSKAAEIFKQQGKHCILSSQGGGRATHPCGGYMMRAGYVEGTF